MRRPFGKLRTRGFVGCGHNEHPAGQGQGQRGPSGSMLDAGPAWSSRRRPEDSGEPSVTLAAQLGQSRHISWLHVRHAHVHRAWPSSLASCLHPLDVPHASPRPPANGVAQVVDRMSLAPPGSELPAKGSSAAQLLSKTCQNCFSLKIRCDRTQRQDICDRWETAMRRRCWD
jgi:hypothetical protein